MWLSPGLLFVLSTTFILLQTQPALGCKILFFHAVGTSSHRTAIWPLAAKLADVGHTVTYIVAVEKEKVIGSHPKIEEIYPTKMIELNRDFVADFDINIRLENRVDEWLQGVFAMGVKICEAFYDSPETQEWLARPNLHYDLVLIDAAFDECAYGLVHKFKAKHILFIPYVSGIVFDTFGLVPESSSIPDPFSNYKPNKMTLLERVWGTLLPMLWRYNILSYLERLEPVIHSKMNVTDMPSITEFERNTSLIYHNGYFIEEHPTSLPPMLISFSGLRCEPSRKTKPLPKNIAAFIDESDGFVYVSLGSAVDVGKMPSSLRKSLFEAFRSYPNLRFLWRWSGASIPEDKPDNVLMAPWFPQLDILGHSKIKAFITQGGRPSTQEAVCSNVPLIMIPIFADQDYNANRMEYLGAAIRLNIETLTQNDVSDAIQQVIENAKYKEEMTKLSNMYKDRPANPVENLLYWTEFAIRHDTSPVMRSLAMNQTWYQRRLLDVYGCILLMVLGFFGWGAFLLFAGTRCCLT